MDGRLPAPDGSTQNDVDAENPDAEPPDGSVEPDVGTDPDGSMQAGDAGVAGDAGPKQCPVNGFSAARVGQDLPLSGKISGDITGDCDTAVHALILAKGQSVHLELWGPKMTPDLRIYGPGVRGFLFQSLKYYPGNLAAIDFTADIPGEYFVYAAQNGRRGSSPYTLTSECRDKCNLRTTRFPTILAHGFSGFKDILSFEYFYQVVDTIAPDGYDLHVSVIDPYNSIEKRGPQLASVIDDVLQQTYARKVNIIGHSQGGLDSRFVISALGYVDKVGMLNTIAAPHQGTPIADMALTDPAIMALFKAFFGMVGIIIEGPENEHALEASLDSMSTAKMIEFNKKYPPDPRVRYRSWTGKTCGPFDGCPKPVDIELLAIYNAVYDKAGDNDGLVPVTSGTWEGFQGVIYADHIDEVGHLLGMTGSFDHLKFYRHVIESMAAEGY